MALADYFDRASESAAQILQKLDRSEFERRLHAQDIVLAYDDTAAASPEALATLDLAVRLLARLYPQLELRPLGKASRIVELDTLALAINPAISLDPARPKKAVALVVGTTALDAPRTIYLGSDRWIARLSAKNPVGSGTSGNPFGAGAAACLGAANLFRAIFGDRLVQGELDRDVTLSLLNYATGKEAGNADLALGVALNSVQLVGIGAIGNAAVWALSRTTGLTGALDLIDHEDVDLGNLQRYVLTERANEGAVKTNLAASFFPGAGTIAATSRPTSWAGFVEATGTHRFELVATALDTARDRVAVQGSLPKKILNAWTQPGDVGVSRHDFLGRGACLACLYLPTGQQRNSDEIIAGELKMPEQLRLVRELLQSGLPVGLDFVRDVARRATAIDPSSLDPFADLPLIAFRAKAICGNAILAAADADTSALQVPMAFQSALAGVMLAAEMVALAADLRSELLPTKSVLDLLRPVPKRLNVPVAKGSAGDARCICADPDYIGAYTAKYGSPGAPADVPPVSDEEARRPLPDAEPRRRAGTVRRG